MTNTLLTDAPWDGNRILLPHAVLFRPSSHTMANLRQPTTLRWAICSDNPIAVHRHNG
jgi:hypothetical protein